MQHTDYFPKLQDLSKAKLIIGEVVTNTPFMLNDYFSKKYSANVFMKREDLQIVRSYKIRGAYHKIKNLSLQEQQQGIVCASAGNHAQGVAFSCNHLGIKGFIYMPCATPEQKIEQVKMFGNGNVEIILAGNTFDQSNAMAVEFATKNRKTFIPPFDDPQIIEGQGTIGMEILHACKEKIDYLFLPIGGGGLASGVGACFKQLSPDTKIIGVEPTGAAGMKLSIENGKVTELEKIDTFVDGAAVKRVGEYTFRICSKILDDIVVVSPSAVCSTIVELYNKNAIVVEPAGALSITALDSYKEQIKGKNVVCIVSGSNNDIHRMNEIIKRADGQKCSIQ